MSQYNQPTSGQHVRIGNWFEELKLKEDTGVRYFPNQRDKSSTLMTKNRCIVHTEQLQPKDYKTTTQDTIIDPRIRPEFSWQKIASAGPRQQLLEFQLKSEAEYDIKRATDQKQLESNWIDYTSENHSQFSRNNFRPSLKSCHRELPLVPSSDAPITIYSDSLDRNRFDFPISSIRSDNPFARNNGFSSDHTHHSASNKGGELVPTITDYQILISFRKRLLKDCLHTVGDYFPGRFIRDFISSLWKYYETNDPDWISVNHLDELLKVKYNFNLMASERKALLLSYCYGKENDDLISLSDLTGLIRRKVSSRRLHLIKLTFNKVSESQESSNSYFNEDLVRAHYRGDSINIVVDDLKFIRDYSGDSSGRDKQTFYVEDFFDLYIDASAEIDNDDEFERFLLDSWK